MKYTTTQLRMLKRQADQLEEAARTIRRDVEFEIAARELEIHSIFGDKRFDETFKKEWMLCKKMFMNLYKFIFTEKF